MIELSVGAIADPVRVIFFWSDESLENFKYNIRRLTARSLGISMAERLQRLSEYIRGWMGYYALSKYYSPLPGLDEWSID